MSEFKAIQTEYKRYAFKCVYFGCMCSLIKQYCYCR